MTHKEELQKAIVESIQNTSICVRGHLAVAFPGKRIFPKYDRCPGKKKKKEMANALAQISARMGVVQIMAILSKPIPKFPHGAAPSGIMGISSSDVVKLESGQMILTGLRSGKTYLQKTITNSHPPTPDKQQ